MLKEQKMVLQKSKNIHKIIWNIEHRWKIGSTLKWNCFEHTFYFFSLIWLKMKHLNMVLEFSPSKVMDNFWTFLNVSFWNLRNTIFTAFFPFAIKSTQSHPESTITHCYYALSPPPPFHRTTFVSLTHAVTVLKADNKLQIWGIQSSSHHFPEYTGNKNLPVA